MLPANAPGDLLAEEYDMVVFDESGALDALPCIYLIHFQDGGTGDNLIDFARTHTVHGSAFLRTTNSNPAFRQFKMDVYKYSFRWIPSDRHLFFAMEEKSSRFSEAIRRAWAII